MQFGLESGSEDVRLKVYKKGYTDEIVYGIPKLLRKHKITYRTNNIMGSPAETLDDMFETARVNKRIKPNGCTVLIYRAVQVDRARPRGLRARAASTSARTSGRRSRTTR